MYLNPVALSQEFTVKFRNMKFSILFLRVLSLSEERYFHLCPKVATDQDTCAVARSARRRSLSPEDSSFPSGSLLLSISLACSRGVALIEAILLFCIPPYLLIG